jgi:hypothetical protein
LILDVHGFGERAQIKSYDCFFDPCLRGSNNQIMGDGERGCLHSAHSVRARILTFAEIICMAMQYRKILPGHRMPHAKNDRYAIARSAILATALAPFLPPLSSARHRAIS